LRTITCTDCGREFPMNGTLVLSGEPLCRPCLEARWIAANKHFPEPPLKAVDPTVCVKCGADHGDQELPQVAGMPVCDECYQKAQNPTFPTWVKMSLAVILALAGFSLAHNWRFFQAYVEAERGKREAQARHYHAAYALLASASRRVPESAELAFRARLIAACVPAEDGNYEQSSRLMAALAKEYPEQRFLAEQARELSAVSYAMQAREASKKQDHAQAVALMDKAVSEYPNPTLQLERDIYQVCYLMDEDRSDEALALARTLPDNVGDDKDLQEAVNAIIGSAERGAAFERGDYDTFLAKAKEFQAQHPDEPGAVAQVASALACKYAVTGQEPYKAQALEMLDKAKKLAVQDEDKEGFKEYEERILHRLKTRQVISKREYDRRFRSATSSAATAPAATQEGRS
jgi:tetratricopeptide (TPR) repeat protein